jgi:hypothetical protein
MLVFHLPCIFLEFTGEQKDYGILTRTRTDVSKSPPPKKSEITPGIQNCHALKLTAQWIPVLERAHICKPFKSRAPLFLPIMND